MGETYLNFEGAKIYPQRPINSQLTLCKCYVMALGPNANGSNFKEGAVNDAIPSLYNIPVIGHLIEDEDGTLRMGSHDAAIVERKDGTYQWKWLTVPFGTVPEDCNAHYEEVTESDGSVKTYLVADMILWTGRYPEVLGAAYSEETYYNHSMEIEVLSSNRLDAPGYSTVDKFQFSALCLLGKSDDAALNEQPCFPSACVKPYAFANDEKWKELFNEFKEELKKVHKGENMEELENTSDVVTDVDVAGSDADVYSDGGAEGAVVSISETTTAEAETVETDSSNFDSNSSNSAVSVDENTPSDGGVLDANTLNDAEYVQNEPDLNANEGEPNVYANLTYKEKRDKLSEAVSAFGVQSDNSFVDYYLDDFCDMFVYVEMDSNIDGVWNEKKLRIPYALNETGVVIDMSKAEEVFARYLTQAEIDKLEQQSSEYSKLVEYKNEKEAEDKRKSFGLVLEKFQDLIEFEEYKEVVKDVMSFATTEDLEMRLYAIRGKNLPIGKKKAANEMRIPIDTKKPDRPLTAIERIMEG